METFLYGSKYDFQFHQIVLFGHRISNPENQRAFPDCMRLRLTSYRF